MELHFGIEYHVFDTDSRLVWVGEFFFDEEGESRHERFSMSQDAGLWRVSIPRESFPPNSKGFTIRYNYRLERSDIPVRFEAPVAHTLRVDDDSCEFLSIHDRWIDETPAHRMRREPVSTLFGLKDNAPSSPISLRDKAKVVAVHFPHLWEGELIVCGASESLGSWQPDNGLLLARCEDDYHFTCPDEDTCYKFVFRQKDGSYLWEVGDNRALSSHDASDVRYVDPPRFEVDMCRLPHQLAGTVLPLFSIRTSRSYGVGDLRDAQTLLEWLHKTGQRVYQLLPIYDTAFTGTLRDTYPYNSVTTYGLNPLYLSVEELPFFETSPEVKSWRETASQLNALPTVAYLESLNLKWEIIKYCFDRWYRYKGYESSDFLNFWTEGGDQLTAYCLFCTLRERHPRREVTSFPEYHRVLAQWTSCRKVEDLEAHTEVMLHAFVQYHLYAQLKALRSKADEYGILLKGDLPIGVGYNSVDVWVEPLLFNTDRNAGAPPDAFSEKGQLWGFPTYNWDVMSADGYKWWRRRLSTMGKYFHAIRIDHILGFFRIWSAPRGESDPCLGHFAPALGYSAEELVERGIMSPEILSDEAQPDHRLLVRDDLGYYHPRVMLSRVIHNSEVGEETAHALMSLHDEYYYYRNEELWRQTALERLRSLMTASDMLLCAEDLGMLPRSVGEVLSSCEILSLEILRMSKTPSHAIVCKDHIPMLSVLSTSTHDMPALREWWENLSSQEQQEIKAFYLSDQPFAPDALIASLFRTSALFVILPLQDWSVLSGYGSTVSPCDERINIPEDAHHIWNYRMYGSVEELMDDADLTVKIRALTQ
ncbi:4-alpha-glucanotransferase [Porphyromonas sp.]|uniref:4-alpha-glucanotransferase n=1 Tax=Porphyromonas sp. TaxID=1924944 RepID=UPI0026DC9AA2|nr:4-alpha-glucanotransferase [Porphyromonas sp.]MDO4770960.1 4-alpha-glucanotransferase [Porphyromonas sp.]